MRRVRGSVDMRTAYNCQRAAERKELVRPEGFEPPTLWSEARCSNPLSYGRMNFVLVGARGFEPPTSSSRTTRATKLRYAPTDPGAAGRLGYRSNPRHVAQYERAGDWLGASLSLPPHTMRTAVEAPRTTVTLNEALFALMVCTSSQTPATRR